MMIASLEKEKKSSEHNMFQNIMYMIRIAWAERKSVLVLCLMLTILPVIENLLNIFIIPSILTAIEENKTLLQLVYTIVIFVGLLMLVGTIYTYFAVKEPFEHAAFRIIMTSKINHKIVHMSYPHMENQDVIKKIERVNKSIIDDNSSTQAIWVSLTNLMKNCLGFAVYLALLSSLETWILGIVLVTAILSFLANRFINRWSHQIKEEEAEYSHKMEYISERASDAVIAKDIRLFGMRNWLETIYNETLQLYHSLVERREKKYILGDCANIALTLIRNGVAYIYLIALVMDGAISAPEFLLYFTSVGSFAGWVDGVFSGIIDMHKYSLEISTLRDFLEYPELFKFEDGESLEMNLSEDYQIQLKNISFRYSPNGKDILKNICLTIKPGEKLAIVGLNGAGKTTLVKLICGFYDPTEGEVLLNGENIIKFNRRDYYRHFSAVFQEFSILPVSLSENISQSNIDFDIEKIWHCVEKSGLKNKIESLPQKLDSRFGKGVFEDSIELSGGEIQSLMLARALYKEAPIIVLDEPTAALDAIAESKLYNKYNDMVCGRTAVYISHRLASTQFCDRIILLEDGEIVEEGTHSELIRKAGKYAEMFEIQGKYYQ